MVTSTYSNMLFGYPQSPDNMITHKLSGLGYRDALSYVDSFISERSSVNMSGEKGVYTVVAEKLIDVEKEEMWEEI